MTSPFTGAQWTLKSGKGFDHITLSQPLPIPPPQGTQCIVHLSAASLNYRDIAMSTGKYLAGTLSPSFIPCSDGAGTIVATGPSVSQFNVGDRVATAFFQDFESGYITPEARKTSLGHPLDGVLREYGTFEERGLVKLPDYLSTVEGATLPCAAVTAWNSLFGIKSRGIEKGQTVLTQGTGGVALFALQIALAKGATVIATTSSDEKAKRLRDLGVQHTINYKSDVTWGETARKLSPDGQGVHHVIEVAGDTSLAQSLKAVRVEGVVSVVGFLGGGGAPQVGTAELMRAACIIRATHVGSREQLGEVMQFFEQHKIRPLVHNEFFDFEYAVDAFRCLQSQNFWGKVVVKIS
ncbi:alcohol dehydrogenase [Melanomma pulvis-pyrius CBS 109.77]|uniref:Alcohol dehydrogenase n=1 Tax=Melanomma pulvis-pyrius CBS 109.77 TaxID=1314802 RepID=A0A6A6XFU2_9PLEO|nr:alcohol dehydrogenase [Melanomma pulvis-pyrius CBS 109.77]